MKYEAITYANAFKNIIVNLCGEKFINRIKYTFSFIYYKKFKNIKMKKKLFMLLHLYMEIWEIKLLYMQLINY